jgi:bacillithiol synthase
LAHTYTHVPYADTGYFSHLVNDHVTGNENISPFFSYAPSAAGLAAAVADRARYPVDRQLLVKVLRRQYASLSMTAAEERNMDALLGADTFTVCTAHQPNLLTGYLYFIYKILHAIRLAEELKALHPGRHFVPVYYMGSEDNDLEELGTFRYGGERYVWDGDGQTGAVGRMSTSGLDALLAKLFRTFGPPGPDCDHLKDLLTKAYLGHRTIGEATRYLVHELFGRYGLLIIDPDDADLKRPFIPVMQDELLHQRSYPIITAQIERLSAHYKIQAHPRPINLFYLIDGLRERIERREDRWIVVNSTISWSQTDLLAELEEHPERFSPNVMLRGLFQESILPDVAFIGGGAEVAYWIQLRTLFTHYKVFYPAVMLRQSVMWAGADAARLRGRLGLSVADVFKPELQLVRDHINTHSTDAWQTGEEAAAIEKVFLSLRQKAVSLDPTLRSSADASLTRMRNQLAVLEKKMLRAEKRKMQVQLSRITHLRNLLFPSGGLQERIENFTEYYLRYGPAFLDVIKDGIDPLTPLFLVIEEGS